MIKQAEDMKAIQIATGEAEFRDAYNDLGELGERVRDWARQLLVNPDGKFDVDRKFGFQDFAAFSELLAENGKPAASKFIAGLSMGRGIIDPRTAIVPGTHNVTVDQAESVGRGLK